MTIYIDVELILNFCYDFLLLVTVDLTLKRQAELPYLILSSSIGALSILLLFWPINKLLLFFLKILISIIMVLLAYGYKDIKYTFNNIFYLYMESVILGGFLYFLNTEFSSKNYGLVFINDGLSINYIVLIIIAPLILGAYIYQNKKIKSLYNYTYEVKIVLKNNKELICRAYLDSGNHLKDPISNKNIILVEEKMWPYKFKEIIYVPFKTLNSYGLLECYKIKYIEINHQKFFNYLVGISKKSFHIEGINCLLNSKLLEEICLEN